MPHPVSDNTEARLFVVPATPRQTQMALAIAIALLAAVGASLPFADRPLPRNDAFIPTLESVVFITDFITSVLLFSQSWVSRSRELLVLASGYLFTSLIVISHVLTFPGAFSPNGLFGAGLQTAGWLYFFWHFGLPTAIIAYACLKGEQLQDPAANRSIFGAVSRSIAVVLGLVCGLTLLVTSGERLLPIVFLDGIHLAPFARYLLTCNVLFAAVALWLLWVKRRSVLDQWLMVVTLALISEVLVNAILISARFTLGWYISRLFAIATSTIVLAVLIQEIVVLYGRISRSNSMLLRERNNRLMSLEAVVGAIKHELRQPLTAIALDGESIGLYLREVPPELEEARLSAVELVDSSHRISEILENIGKLFGTTKTEPSPVDVNDLTLVALRTFGRELKTHGVGTHVELASELPPVLGNRSQLLEVIVNVIQNAIEEMERVDDKQKELRVKTERRGDDSINITIADTGLGIDPNKSEEMFEAFFTTKSNGMGLGLAICRMIIERHGGQLSVSAAKPHGAIFEIALPQLKPLAKAEHFYPPLVVDGPHHLQGRGERIARTSSLHSIFG